MSEDIQKQIEELNKQVEELKSQVKFHERIPLLTRITELSREYYGEEHPEYAASLNNLGLIYRYVPDYHTAETLIRKAMAIRKKALGDQHTDYARSLNNLAILFSEMGNNAAAIPLYHQALEIWRNEVGEEHINHLNCLNNLANAYEAMGNYSSAEELYIQAREKWGKIFGNDHYQYARYLNGMALLYTHIGHYSSAEQLFLQEREIYRKTFGEDQPDYIRCVNNLADVYNEMGRYSDAVKFHLQVKEKWLKVYNEEHPTHASVLKSLANDYYKMGNYDDAEETILKAKEIFEKVWGEEHPDYSSYLSSSGILYSEMGRYPEADSFFKQAMKIRLKMLSEKHPEVAESLVELAKLYPAIGKEKESYRFIRKASGIYDYLISQIFSFGSESQRMDYLKKIQPALDVHLSIVYKYFSDSSDKIKATLDLVLRRKAIGAEALAAQRDAVLGGKYPELNENLKELTMLRNQIALKEFKGPGPEGKEYHDKLIKEWTEKKEKLESDLVRQIPEMNLEEQLRKADRNAISKALPKDSVLVEFVKFNEFDFKAIPANGDKRWKPARYLAFVLPARKPGKVQMIDLGEAEPIDRLISDFRSSMFGEYGLSDRSATKSIVTKTADNMGITLRNAVFDGISDLVKGFKHVFISPDGDLSRLPFEVLPSGDNRYLIDDYRISYLSVGRDVLRFNAESSGHPEDSIVAADPDFNMGTMEQPKQPELEYASVRGWRSSKDLNRTELYFDRLPGTRPESDKISSILKTKSWVDDKVLESKLKSIHSPFILHLATHGFFLEDQKVELGKETGPRYENPLLRSGLALAGANTSLKGGSLPDEAEDGILTAEDVSGLDLLGTELVVLSACETGLGEIRTGEGVFGLRRAFMLAGAKTLVMSLWKVTDLATPILMERFYDNLLNKGLERDESLREAQMFLRGLTIKEIRNLLTDDVINRISDGNDKIKQEIDQFLKLPDSTTPFADPLFWGAFICQGVTYPLHSKRN
jgi:CHAT domain-containing protein/tetratricopeptide (TPR) repeat protein